MERSLYGPVPSLDGITAFSALRRSAGSGAGMLRALDEYARFLSERDVQQYHEGVFLEHELHDSDVAFEVASALISEYASVLFPDHVGVHPALVMADLTSVLALLAQHLRGLQGDLVTE
jgi:hypothetical protein